MPLQKFGDREIGLHLAQGPVKPTRVRERPVVEPQTARPGKGVGCGEAIDPGSPTPLYGRG